MYPPATRGRSGYGGLTNWLLFCLFGDFYLLAMSVTTSSDFFFNSFCSMSHFLHEMHITEYWLAATEQLPQAYVIQWVCIECTCVFNTICRKVTGENGWCTLSCTHAQIHTDTKRCKCEYKYTHPKGIFSSVWLGSHLFRQSGARTRILADYISSA